MPFEATSAQDPVQSLNKAFLLNYPTDAARRIESLPPQETVEILRDHPAPMVARVLDRLAPGAADAILTRLPVETAAGLLTAMEIGTATSLLARMETETQSAVLARMTRSVAAEFRALLDYPVNTAGRLMNTRITALNAGITVGEALAQVKNQGATSLRHLFLLGDDLRLRGEVDMHRLPLADAEDRLIALSVPAMVYAESMEPLEDVVDKLGKHHLTSIPVVDVDHRLVGIIEGRGAIDALREDATADMQTMVGVSRDERALSSSWFAVRKRLPWLQINLLTAFLASAVVGLFESTIAQYTALAVLLPIAAGQSGNTGAQALAVTMRGLTLREITVRHWLRVTLKEAGAALINGTAVALTCGLGVYLWSGSFGLSLILALAMVSSMLIASVSGALVPIVLQRLGKDPALSSSIILTTVTDIAGFLSFLGIATLLSGMLEGG